MGYTQSTLALQTTRYYGEKLIRTAAKSKVLEVLQGITSATTAYLSQLQLTDCADSWVPGGGIVSAVIHIFLTLAMTNTELHLSTVRFS